MSDFDDIKDDVRHAGDAVSVEIFYPRQRSIKAVQVGLCDVRAADDVRIEYDFERDGWKVSQRHYAQADGYMTCDGAWHEMAFLPAWPGARKEGAE